ncbi:MAG: hypothetical protein PVH41_12825, partial [Anaerolineae bacterium]
NPRQSDERPWDYVLLRHVPVAPDTFAFYDEYVLPEFDNAPTWKYATPHNIQRATAQNQSCDSCHENYELFLTADDVDAQELAANTAVIVEQVPPIMPHPGLETYEIPQACVRCHPQAALENWELVNDNVHALNYVVEPAGDVIECEDCHGPDGSFDWTVAGYDAEEASQFVWTGHPPTTEIAYRDELGWLGVLVIGLGIGIVISVVVGVALQSRRSKAVE